MDSDKYEDLGGFLDDIQLYREGELCLFRGQSCNKPLLAKIARRDRTVDTSKIEREMLAELRRRGTLFIGREIADDWDLMVYAQHFGMATRLLDWTSNPLAALWFAAKDLNKQKSGFVYFYAPTKEHVLSDERGDNPFKVGR